ncbi:MAG: FIST N-terminal domain-containing protein [Ghiorsea sp.]
MMNIYEGFSKKKGGEEAVAEAMASWNVAAATTIDMIFAFHSTSQDAEGVAKALQERFPKAQVIGSTTSGEWTTGAHLNDSLVLTAISSPDIRWAVQPVSAIAGFNTDKAEHILEQLLGKLNINRSDLTPKKHFCIGLFDGIVGADGSAVAAMSDALGDMPLIGGMAGDDLKFKATKVIANGEVFQGGAAFILAESLEYFEIMKHQHFVPGETNMVITKVGENVGHVLRIDGQPAAQRYADLLGLTVEDLTFQVFSDHPVIYSFAGEAYVRSIQSVGDDDSLNFYCAVEEGMLLNLCEHRDMIEALKSSVDAMIDKQQKVQLYLMCNCIFRTLESEVVSQSQDLAKYVASAGDHVVGFDTYGEVWNGLHINQSLVGLALGKA